MKVFVNVCQHERIGESGMTKKLDKEGQEVRSPRRSYKSLSVVLSLKFQWMPFFTWWTNFFIASLTFLFLRVGVLVALYVYRCTLFGPWLHRAQCSFVY